MGEDEASLSWYEEVLTAIESGDAAKLKVIYLQLRDLELAAYGCLKSLKWQAGTRVVLVDIGQSQNSKKDPR
jgi:hypothetical protein